MNLNKNYWDNRYEDKEIGWDVGTITIPIKEYFDQLTDKSIKILIPGCGFGHEAEYLWKSGFCNLYVLDISPIPLQNFKNRIADFPEENLICADFFGFKIQDFDVIVEQTFFCALNPELRPHYARKMSELLKHGGKLVGVLFDDKLNSDKPPFGGSKEEYISYFRSLFEFRYFDKCYNSIPPRAGRELFICFIKS